MTAFRIAIVGAESTGKTALASGLSARLADLTGLRCTWVPEWLRQWCDQEGRTPRPDEQRGIAEHQHALIEQACSRHELVVCDTTALMTAVYSGKLFNDHSLDAYAVAQQRRCDLTLLTALDIPWVADGLQRDGPEVRPPVDARVRALLLDNALPWSLVAGQGEARLQTAVDAVTPLLRGRQLPATGLFTRLDARDAQDRAYPWMCADCDDPACEHALRQGRGLPTGDGPRRSD